MISKNWRTGFRNRGSEMRYSGNIDADIADRLRESDQKEAEEAFFSLCAAWDDVEWLDPHEWLEEVENLLGHDNSVTLAEYDSCLEEIDRLWESF
jgi:hypothetical protein